MSDQQTLSEAMSKQLLAPFGFPFTSEAIVNTSVEAGDAADAMGYPVVVKLNGSNIAHKTERGLVRLQLADRSAVEQAAVQLLALATVSDGKVQLLVARMIDGSRELIVGMVNDPVFGKTAMLGIGGIFAEVIQDVVFAPLPINQNRALEMIDALKYKSMLQEFRGQSAVNVGALADALVAMSAACDTHNEIFSIDINPLIVQRDGSLVAVDALVEVLSTAELPTMASTSSNTQMSSQFAQYDSLFSPRAIVVVGASSHPGKFGFVSLHNILSNKFAGKVYATNLAGEVILGIQTVASIDELPMNEIDLAFFCTPASANPSLLRQCAARGIRAAFIASAGYREAGPSGEQAERDLVLLATELGMVVAGPNGQGVVSTPVSMCAQIVGPYPPRGAISVASQSGNFVSSFLNYARQTGVGIARAISAGNAAQTSVGDYLEWFSQDSETRVSLAYIESVNDGKALEASFSRALQNKPLVVVKGGATDLGSRAAQSHTGAMASNDKIFDGLCRSTGASRAATVEEAFDIAATFATQPLPKGNRVVVLTTVGGWGVVTSDAIAKDGALHLVPLPTDLTKALDELLPPRWSRNNPIDCAGGETRDTIPEILELICAHDDIDAVIFLGLGIQSNQARMMSEGEFYPDHGLERIVAYHRRQDERFAQSAAECAVKYNKPVLVATELAVADPSNPGPATVRETGRLCYASGTRAATALAHMYRYARFTGVAK
ncbi:MAG: acetate--CoA ligase family protein [Actinobacteria bacterium]|nr:acetate--CoA ligase family protein [Actinomycetota bacterium]